MTSIQRIAQRTDPDADLLACSTLTRVDHVDAHQLRTSHAHSPAEWAREILEGPPAVTRLRLRLGWTMLGIRLRPAGPDVIAGWSVTHRDAEYVRLQAMSPMGLSGQLITRVAGGEVTFATFVRLGNPVARRVWAKVLPTHLAVVCSLVDGAASRSG